MLVYVAAMSFLLMIVGLMLFNFICFLILMAIIFVVYGTFFCFVIIGEWLNKDKRAEEYKLQSYAYKKNEMINKYNYLNLDSVNYEKLICLLMFNWYIVETTDSVIILKKRNEIKIFKRNEKTWETVSFEFFMLNLRSQYSQFKMTQENYEKMICLLYFGWSVHEVYTGVVMLIRHGEIKPIPLIDD